MWLRHFKKSITSIFALKTKHHARQNEKSLGENIKIQN